jgi:hypothetical protein
MSEFESLLDDRIKSVIARTLKQVSHDYNLDYKELKSRYCSKESLEVYDVPGNTQVVTVDLEVEVPPAEVPKVVKAKAPVAVMALSKMKKGDLVKECEERGLESEGTVTQLKERVKEAREKEGDPKKKPKAKEPKEPKAKPVKEPKEPKAKPVKEPKAKPVKEPAKAVKKVKEVPAPPPPPVALEEEEEDEDEDEDPDDVDVCKRVVEDEEEEDEDDDDDVGDSLQEKLRKILAEADAEEEEDYDDEE